MNGSTHTVPKTVAVVGGGITGIVAALNASANGHTVHLFERTDFIGGKIDEWIRPHGRAQSIPTGPDAFLARRPEVAELAISLGLANQLVSPAAGSARIYRDGRLHPLPPSVLGVPASGDLSQTGLISADGAARASLDLDAPDDHPNGDESVGAMVRRRLGDEVHEYLVDPLLGGINAGDSDRLSVVSGVPQLDVLRKKHTSLMTAATQTLAAAPSNPGPVFQSIDGGLNRLIDAAEAELGRRTNVSIHLSTSAELTRGSDSAWAVSGIDTDEVILTTPAGVTADLIRTLAPAGADELEAIDYSSVALTILILPPNTIDIDPAISGVLVPRLCGLHVTAVSFASHKWPDLAPDGSQILRVSVGRRTDERWSQLRDAEVIQLVRNDLSEIFGTIIPDGPAHLTRWMDSLPQYDVGHAERIRAIDDATRHLDGLVLTGAWRSGLGLPACVASGRAATAKST